MRRSASASSARASAVSKTNSLTERCEAAACKSRLGLARQPQVEFFTSSGMCRHRSYLRFYLAGVARQCQDSPSSALQSRRSQHFCNSFLSPPSACDFQASYLRNLTATLEPNVLHRPIFLLPRKFPKFSKKELRSHAQTHRLRHLFHHGAGPQLPDPNSRWAILGE
jgi:hypothetical protein